MSYKKSIGQPFIYPRNDLTYCENFLQMMFAVPSEPYEIDPDFVEALNLLLIVHADHEQNCSTSTVRMVGSSDANLFASISAGICALWGPLHGGANQACVEMLEAILADGGNVNKYVDLAKDKNSKAPPDGLWPSRLQELRPAGHDHQKDLRQAARQAAHQRPDLRHRPGTRSGGPAAIPISSSASSIRTSISIRA